MKQLLLLLLVSLPFSIFAQKIYHPVYIMPIDSSTNLVNYIEIDEIINQKDQLFKNAQTWVTKTYGDYKAVIQFEDKQAGKLIIKAISNIGGQLFDQIRYTFSIECKDNKYRAIISDIETSGSWMRAPVNWMPVIAKFNTNIEPQKQKIKEIEALIQNTTKKSDLKRLNKELFEVQESLARDYVFGTSMNQKANELFASLKKALSTPDNF